jgi:hypothetical protein
MPKEQKPTGIVLVADGIHGCLGTTLKEALAPTDYALMHVLQGRQWTNINDTHSTLKEAKIEAEAKVTGLTGTRSPVLKWH